MCKLCTFVHPLENLSLLDAGSDGFEGDINTRKYMSLTKTSRPTACRELAEMV